MSEKPRLEVIHFADPWCWWSWGLEPIIQRLREVYGDQIGVVYKMGGITDDVSEWRREYDVVDNEALKNWIRESSSITGTPVDPECYIKTGVNSTWPAGIAVKAAQMQGEDVGERFYRRLMEGNLLESKNGSEEEAYLKTARKVGLDTDLLTRDIKSGKAREAFSNDREAMNVSFLTLTYIDTKTGESKNVGDTFASSNHERMVEELTGGKLTKRTPVDILEYMEHHRGEHVSPKEISEVFSTSEENAKNRLSALAGSGLLKERTFGYGAAYWSLEGRLQEKLTLEQVKVAHVAGSAQLATGRNMEEVITNAVKGLYTQVATNPLKTYHFPLGRRALLHVGYPEEEIDKLPETALESFAGVGYPHAADAIKVGDTVLDIGSGSGTDVLIASLRTGPMGHVFGLDITDAMIEKANRNIAKMGATNVKILKGEATRIPLDDASVDVATSNGVLNLVPEKGKAFQEIYRVLKPGGRIQISDIVVESDVQKVCGLIPQLWADCIGGAAVESGYLKTIRDAGFKDAKVIRRVDYFAASSSDNTKRLTKTFGAESVVITGTKPS